MTLASQAKSRGSNPRRRIMKYNIVITTTEKKEDAERISEILVNEKLAACVQILGPMKSIYHWKGNLEKTEEYLCLIKTKDNVYTKLEQKIKEIHPYETPEIVSVPIIKGSKEYLAFLDKNIKEP